MIRSRVIAAAFSAALVTLSLALLGCELDSADSVTRDVDADFTGFYTGNEGPLVSRNSGDEITMFNLRQTGDEIEIIDNNGMIFRGTLGDVNTSGGSATASFLFTGKTTEGMEITASGTLTGEGTSGTMTGTWIEPAFYATISGKATINPVVTNTTPETTGTLSLITITPSSATLLSNGETRGFSASGGSGSGYSWTVANSHGELSVTAGSSTTYTRNSVGDNTITVTDDAGHNKSATISQP
jgi:hypothetical protein